MTDTRAAAAAEVATARKDAETKRQQYANEAAEARKKSIDEIGIAQKESAEGVQKARQEAAAAIGQARDNEARTIAETKAAAAAEINKVKNDATEIIVGENKKVEVAKQEQIIEGQKLTQLLADIKKAEEDLKILKEEAEKIKKKD